MHIYIYTYIAKRPCRTSVSIYENSKPTDPNQDGEHFIQPGFKDRGFRKGDVFRQTPGPFANRRATDNCVYT